MVFSFYQQRNILDSSNKSIDHRLFTIGSKKERKVFSKFIKEVQFTIPNIKIDLTCFPQMKDYNKYNDCLTDRTLRSEVIDLVRELNIDGYFLVAEVALSG